MLARCLFLVQQMILQSFHRPHPAHASYLVGDERSKVAAIVDPQPEVEAYLDAARAEGLVIRYALMTCFRADCVPGLLALARRTGAHVYLGASAAAECPFTPLIEGDVLEFGDVRLGVLDTPGCRPEALSFTLFDLTASDRAPVAVFTGDTLSLSAFDRARSTATAGITIEELAGRLYASLHKLLTLPDATLVLPAHGTGSLDESGRDEGRGTTLGEQRRYNYALQPMGKASFIALVTGASRRAEEPR